VDGIDAPSDLWNCEGDDRFDGVTGHFLGRFGPAFKTVGLQGFDAEFWYGIVAPAGTPAAIVERIQAAIAKYVNSPEGKKAFVSRSLEPVGSTAGQFAATIQKDIERFTALAKQFNIQPQ
jgi:tripartite-type tricarboxylate transporter receptor subunit TctC